MRTSECAAVLAAEDVYTRLRLSTDLELLAGAVGVLTWRVEGLWFDVTWETQPNHIWPLGRVILRCRQCQRAAGRLYLPRTDTFPACRQCWGLTYPSRQAGNYKRQGSSRLIAEFETERRRALRLAAAVQRRRLRTFAAPPNSRGLPYNRRRRS